MAENEEKKTTQMSDEDIKAYADVIVEEREAEKNASGFKKACIKVKHWTSDHPVATFLIGVATGGVGVIAVLLIVSAVAKKAEEKSDYDMDDISIENDELFNTDDIKVEV